MSQINTNVTADKLYEEAFSIKYAWEHMLPKEVFEYHNLIFRECNAPVDLQMGTILPFVASCLGFTHQRPFSHACLLLKFVLDPCWSIGCRKKSEVGRGLSQNLSNIYLPMEEYKFLTLKYQNLHAQVS